MAPQQPPNRILHPYQPQPRIPFKQSGGYETFEPQNVPVYEPQNYKLQNAPVYEPPNYKLQNAPAYEPQFPQVTIPSRQQIQNSVTREPKLADRIKPKPKQNSKIFGKEANYLNFGFKTPAHVKTAPVQKQKNKAKEPPYHFEEPYKFQDPFVNAFPQLQQAFNIHSNLRGHASNEEFGSGGAYIPNNYNSIPQSEQPFDPYAHITHHPHGLVHVNLGNNIDGQIKQIEINNNGELQAHLENDFDNDNEDEDDASEEDGGMGEEEGGGDDGDDGFDELLKEDNQKKLPYTGVIGHGRALTSIYPKGPMLFSHEHYDVTPKYLQQVTPVPPLQQVQQNHLVTPTPTPAALQPLQPLYHRQFVPIQHLQPPSQEEHNQFVHQQIQQHPVQPIQNFNYNTFKK